ncbi:hypothetical protein Pint_20053 [Pistacia integerrima]|uniref:Uncharacterized protein n=1 Tax=Pistacia integerrima TaxID=434235 RepID=A0ACC0X9P0_9ROSI|nr:hypothetical protein Pint_20053 [Pistacia integerrima]
MLKCLEEGPWLFQHRPILLQRWQPEMELNKESPLSILLWVKFYNVLLELWSVEGLSYIASGVGRPLSMDRITEDTCRNGVGHIGFARVLIEVEASKKLPEEIKVKMPSEVCNVFGHNDQNCPKQPKGVSPPTQMASEGNKVMDSDGFQLVSRKGKEKQPAVSNATNVPSMRQNKDSHSSESGLNPVNTNKQTANPQVRRPPKKGSKKGKNNLNQQQQCNCCISMGNIFNV